MTRFHRAVACLGGLTAELYRRSRAFMARSKRYLTLTMMHAIIKLDLGGCRIRQAKQKTYRGVGPEHVKGQKRAMTQGMVNV